MAGALNRRLLMVRVSGHLLIENDTKLQLLRSENTNMVFQLYQRVLVPIFEGVLQLNGTF